MSRTGCSGWHGVPGSTGLACERRTSAAGVDSNFGIRNGGGAACSCSGQRSRARCRRTPGLRDRGTRDLSLHNHRTGLGNDAAVDVHVGAGRVHRCRDCATATWRLNVCCRIDWWRAHPILCPDLAAVVLHRANDNRHRLLRQRTANDRCKQESWKCLRDRNTGRGSHCRSNIACNSTTKRHRSSVCFIGDTSYTALELCTR